VKLELDTIYTKGKKEVPSGTKIELRRGTTLGTVSVRLTLPGQKVATDFEDLVVKDGAIELPVNLVFLSHAKEDAEIVAALSERLLQDGIMTWFGEKDLSPGDDWKLEIDKGIKHSDYVLVFLSAESVSKVGYCQKELRIALEYRTLKPEGTSPHRSRQLG